MSSFKQQKYLTEDLIGCTNKSKTITARSGWEISVIKWMQDLTKTKRIKSWSSEDMEVKYLFSLDNEVHRYYPDIIINKNNGNIVIVEVKPFAQTIHPKKPKAFKSDKARITYDNAVNTFIKNSDKWKSTMEWCKKENKRINENKYSFIIWTEQTKQQNPNPGLVFPVLNV